MYTALLRAQWKSMAPATLVLALIVFAVPVWQLVGAQVLAGGTRTELALPILGALISTSGVYPLLAYVGGSLLAAGSWWDDFQGKHVYALVLPVPRWYYLLVRMATGLTFVAAVVIALWLSAVIASGMVNLPQGLHAYPGGLAVRFALATSVAFVITFTLCSASQTVLRIVLWSVLGMLVLSLLIALMGQPSPAVWLINSILRWPGIVDTFVGRWTFIDV